MEVGEKHGTGGISRAPVGGVSNDFPLDEVGSFWKVLSKAITQFILLFSLHLRNLNF